MTGDPGRPDGARAADDLGQPDHRLRAVIVFSVPRRASTSSSPSAGAGRPPSPRWSSGGVGQHPHGPGAGRRGVLHRAGDLGAVAGDRVSDWPTTWREFSNVVRHSPGRCSSAPVHARLRQGAGAAGVLEQSRVPAHQLRHHGGLGGGDRRPPSPGSSATPVLDDSNNVCRLGHPDRRPDRGHPVHAVVPAGGEGQGGACVPTAAGAGRPLLVGGLPAVVGRAGLGRRALVARRGS